jgi:hypothetical protein
MAEQRVPNLEEMNEQEAHRFLTELFSSLSAREEYELRHQEDYVMEMPQSGEAIRGRENMRSFQEAYPTPPTIQLRRVLVRDELWVVEGINEWHYAYGGKGRPSGSRRVGKEDALWPKACRKRTWKPLRMRPDQ